MEDTINARFVALIERGAELVRTLPRESSGYLAHWVQADGLVPYQTWLSSVSNLILTVAPAGSYFADECQRLLTHQEMKRGVPSQLVQKAHGLLVSAKEEWGRGLLRKIEYMIAAATFDDFLDHATAYDKGYKKTEAAVLASAVLEDTVKKIGGKHGLSTAGVTLDPLIDALASAGIFTPVKAKRVKSYAGVRNHALHADWDLFDIRDVGDLIKGTRELIEEFL